MYILEFSCFKNYRKDTIL